MDVEPADDTSLMYIIISGTVPKSQIQSSSSVNTSLAYACWVECVQEMMTRSKQNRSNNTEDKKVVSCKWPLDRRSPPSMDVPSCSHLIGHQIVGGIPV